jgi:hypothetical protein
MTNESGSEDVPSVVGEASLLLVDDEQPAIAIVNTRHERPTRILEGEHAPTARANRCSTIWLFL